MSRSRSQQPARPRSCSLELNGSPSIRCRSCRRARTTIPTPTHFRGAAGHDTPTAPFSRQIWPTPVSVRRAPTHHSRPLTRKGLQDTAGSSLWKEVRPRVLTRNHQRPTKLLGIDNRSTLRCLPPLPLTWMTAAPSSWLCDHPQAMQAQSAENSPRWRRDDGRIDLEDPTSYSSITRLTLKG